MIEPRDRPRIQPWAAGALTLAGGLSLFSLATWCLTQWFGQTAAGVALWEVHEQTLRQELNLTGRLEPGAVHLITAPFDGRILRRLADDGQPVEQGQILLELDTTLLQREIAEARMEEFKAGQVYEEQKHWYQGTEVARARRALTTSRLNHEETLRKLSETRGLLARGIVARMEVDALEQQEKLQKLEVSAAAQELQSAEAKGTQEQFELAALALENSRQRHKELRQMLTQREVRAPEAGVLISVAQEETRDHVKALMQEGAVVSRGQALFAVASQTTFNVAASVNEMDINLLRIGQRAGISGAGFEGVLEGSIRQLAAQAMPGIAENSSARYAVMVATDTIPETIRPHLRLGMSVNISVLLREMQDAIVIPPSAVFEAQGRHFVKVEHVGRSLELREIELGMRVAEGVEVRGLRAGEQVRVTPQ